MRRERTVALLLGIALPGIEAVVLLYRIVSPPGFLFFGDTAPILNPSLTLRDSFTTWNFQFQQGVSDGFLWTPYYLIYASVSALTGPALASRAVAVMFAAAPGIGMFFLARTVARPWFGSGLTELNRTAISLVSSQVYLLNFVNVGFTNPLVSWSFVYLSLPFMLWGAWAYFSDGKLWGLPLFAVSTAFCSENPFWIEELLLAGVPLLIVTSFCVKRSHGWKSVLERATILSCCAIAANAFWGLPLLYQYHIGVQSYSSTSVPLSFTFLVFQSRGFQIIDVLLLGHSTYLLFGTWTQNWTLFSLVPALLLFTPLLGRGRRSPCLLACFVSLLLGMFLSKGANPPLGSIYYDIAVNLPLGFGTLFRNGGSIFLTQVMFEAALIIGYSVIEVIGWLPGWLNQATAWFSPPRALISTPFTWKVRPRWTMSHRARNLQVASFVILLSLVLAPLTYGTLRDQTVYGPAFVSTQIPPSYPDAINYVADNGSSYNVAWIPNGCCGLTDWKPYLLTDFPAIISYTPSFTNWTELVPFLGVPASNTTAEWAYLLGIRYLVLHSDVSGFPYSEFNASLRNSTGISEAMTNAISTVYQVHSPAIPSQVYLLGATGEYDSGFAFFGGDTSVGISTEGTESIGPYVASFSGNSNGTLGIPFNFSADENFAIGAWIRTTSTSTQIIVQDNDYGAVWSGWVLGLQNGGYPYFQAGQTSSTQFQGLVSNTTVADGEWHFLLGERNGTTWDLYVDGALVASKTNMPSIDLSSAQDASVAARIIKGAPTTWNFSGNISGILVNNQSIDSREVLELNKSGPSALQSRNFTNAWLLQNQNSTKIPDLSANGVQLQLSNVSWVPAGLPTLNMAPGQNFAIGAWIRTTSTSTQIIVQDNDYGAVWSGWVLGLQNGGYPYFQAGQTSSTQFQGLVSNTTVADGEWHFLLGERNGTTWDLYVDGALVASKTNMPSIALAPGTEASIGGRLVPGEPPAWLFDGAIGEVSIVTSSFQGKTVEGIYQQGLEQTPQSMRQYGPILLTLLSGDSLTSPADYSGSGFQLSLQGELHPDSLALPLAVTQPSNAAIESATQVSPTHWALQIDGKGFVKLILAEPFSTGWTVSGGDQVVHGAPCFGNLVIGFNLSVSGNQSFVLTYGPQVYVLYGYIASGVGIIAVMAAALWVKRKPTKT